MKGKYLLTHEQVCELIKLVQAQTTAREMLKSEKDPLAIACLSMEMREAFEDMIRIVPIHKGANSDPESYDIIKFFRSMKSLLSSIEDVGSIYGEEEILEPYMQDKLESVFFSLSVLVRKTEIRKTTNAVIGQGICV